MGSRSSGNETHLGGAAPTHITGRSESGSDAYAHEVTEREGLLSPRYRTLSFAIYTTIALVAFEGTSVAAALPELAADLGSVDLLPWVVTSFLFATGLSTVVSGALVDALGSRRLFVWSAVVFSCTGFAAGLVGNLPTLIVMRLLQGSASGVLFAATIAAVNLGFPSELTGRAFAANATIWGLMGAASPAIAAALLSVASWRWIFFINLPLGMLALAAGRNRMPERQPGAEPPSIDWRGAALAAVFTGASIAAISSLSWRSIVFGLLCVSALVVYGLHARRAARPVVSLQHIAAQPYRSLALVPSLMLAAAFTTNIYVTVYVAAGRGWSSGGAAWSVIYFTVGWTIGANISSRLLDQRRVDTVMAIGLGVGSIGLAVVCIGVVPNGPLAIVFAGLTLLGVGIGLTTNATLHMLRAETPAAVIGRASAANQFARSQGFVLGAAAGGAILLLVVERRIGSVEAVRSLLAGEETIAGAEVAEAVRVGYGVVAIVSLAVILLAILPMVSLVRDRR